MKVLAILSIIASLMMLLCQFAHAQSYFYTQPPHSQQPSGGACASWIAATPEKIPANTQYNYATPSYSQLQAWWNNEPTFIGHSYLNRVDGQYSGSTDMIIRWAACKWGIDENLARAAVWGESGGYQSTANDWTTDFSLCPPDGSFNGNLCAATYGISQIRYSNLHGTWPLSRNSTAWNLDYRFAQWRACMDGAEWNFYGEQPVNGQPTYPHGDTYQMTWGCMQSWYTGAWWGEGGDSYNSWIQSELNDQKWLN